MRCRALGRGILNGSEVETEEEEEEEAGEEAVAGEAWGEINGYQTL